MSDVSIKYKGNTITTFDNSDTKILSTQGKYCEDDITVEYTKPKENVIDTEFGWTEWIPTAEYGGAYSSDISFLKPIVDIGGYTLIVNAQSDNLANNDCIMWVCYRTAEDSIEVTQFTYQKRTEGSTIVNSVGRVSTMDAKSGYASAIHKGKKYLYKKFTKV